ncbi:MAG TPA: hypothetical protein EYP29_04405, partial [Thermoplasmata archaeon]|nr:hypothetical protein [Thermoplasmata archaeon]
NHTLWLKVQDNYGIWSNETIWDKNLSINLIPLAFIDKVNPNPVPYRQKVLFKGHGIGNTKICRYSWFSSLDGELYNGTDTEFTTSNLSFGTHNISLKVKDGWGLWSEAVNITLEVVAAEEFPSDYNAGKCSLLFQSSKSQTSPSIYKNLIAWQDNFYGDWNIFLFDLNNPEKIKMISNVSSELPPGSFEHHLQTDPVISEGKVLWLYQGWNFTENHNIFMLYDTEKPVEGAVSVLETSSFPLELKFSYPWIIWKDFSDSQGSFFALYSYNIETKEKKKLMEFDGEWALWKDKLLYFEEPTTQIVGKETTILKILNLTNGKIETNITFLTKPSHISNPDFCGDYIVWEDHRLNNGSLFNPDNTDIYFINIAENLFGRITTNQSTQLNPRVQGDYIIWEDKRNGNGVYAYSISKDKMAVLAENKSSIFVEIDVYGSYAVFVNEIDWSHSAVYLFDLNRAEWLKSEAEIGVFPTLSEDEIKIEITEPEDGVTVNKTVLIKGEAYPLISSKDAEIFIKIDDGMWQSVTAKVYGGGICAWQHSWNSLEVENGIHTISVKAKKGSVESEIVTITVNVNNSFIVVVNEPVWKEGEERVWKCTYLLPEPTTFTVHEKVLKRGIVKNGVTCYELEVWAEGVGEKSRVYLAENNFTLVEYVSSGEESMFDIFLFPWLGALDFPFSIEKENEESSWTEGGEIEVEAGSFKVYKYNGTENFILWYSPEFGHVVKIESHDFSVEAVSLSQGGGKEEESSFLFKEIGPLPLLAYLVLLVLGCAAAGGFVFVSRKK